MTYVNNLNDLVVMRPAVQIRLLWLAISRLILGESYNITTIYVLIFTVVLDIEAYH